MWELEEEGNSCAEVIDFLAPGQIAPVASEVWRYEVSGMKVVKRWFDRRKREPEGRRSSPLDDVVAPSWHPEWTTELLEVLNVLTLLVELVTPQAPSSTASSPDHL